MRHRGPDVARAGRAGFSVLELVVVIAILAGLTGLVLPAMYGWIARARFEESLRQLPGVFAIARAEARGDGVPRRLIASRMADGVSVISVERVERPDVAEGAREPAADGAGTQDAASPQVSTAAASKPPVRVMELPPGCEVAAAGGGTDEQTAEGASAGSPLTIVIYLPDGGAISASRVVVRGPGGRESALRFDRVTGRVHVSAAGGGTGMAIEERAEEPEASGDSAAAREGSR